MLYDTSNIGKFYKDQKRKEELPTIVSGVSPAVGGKAPPSSYMGNISEALTGGGPTQSSGASRFVNFERILDVNKEGAAKMAESLVGGTEKKVKSAEEAAKKVGDAATQQIKAGTPKPDTTSKIYGKPDFSAKPAEPEKPYTPGVLRNEGLQGTPQNVVVEPGGTGEVGYAVGASPQNPGVTGKIGEGLTASEKEGIPVGYVSEAEAKRRASAQYTGPKTFSDVEGYDAAEKAYQDALSALKSYGQPGGIEAQLNELYGTAGGTGGSRLDTALTTIGLGGPEKYRDRFGKLAKALDEQSYLERYQPGVEQSISEAEKIAEDSRKYWEGKLKEGEGYGLTSTPVSQEEMDAYVKEMETAARAEADQKAWEEENLWPDGRPKPSSGETRSMSPKDMAATMGYDSVEAWYAAGRPWYSEGRTIFLDKPEG